MPATVIDKSGVAASDTWQHLADSETVVTGNVTITWNRFRTEASQWLNRSEPLGIRLGSADEPAELVEHLGKFALISLDFPAFADGRLFSSATLLRERLGYNGELRARGDYLSDQVFFLTRVGVDSFELNANHREDEIRAALSDFSVKYQAAVDEPRPLYRRR